MLLARGAVALAASRLSDSGYSPDSSGGQSIQSEKAFWLSFVLRPTGASFIIFTVNLSFPSPGENPATGFFFGRRRAGYVF
jgi:hypothetical protein